MKINVSQAKKSSEPSAFSKTQKKKLNPKTPKFF